MAETTHAPDVDLVITFCATRKTHVSKQQAREDVRKAQQQYTKLINTLTYAGLTVVGRRGESLGHLLVFVKCPPKRVQELVKKERQSDFLSGLPVTPVSSAHPLSSADRIRLIYSYIASSHKDGGLGVSPDSPEWDLIESIFTLHDKQFNESWLKTWKSKRIFSFSLEKIRDQFGDSIAFYFAFLGSYTRFLTFPAFLGLTAYYFLPAYSPFYSILICLWSIVFVEWWRVHERILSLRFATRGSFNVEKRRAQYKQGMRWWVREARVLASVPVILVFAGFLSALLTAIFVFEAFVTQLYQGPGKQLITLTPTLLFVALVPRVLAIYQSVAVALTKWENHRHQSTYAASLTLKTFALSAIVAYLGLSLSAFVYVPFGEGVMQWVQAWLFRRAATAHGFAETLKDMLNVTVASTLGQEAVSTFGASQNEKPSPTPGADGHHHFTTLWDTDTLNVRTKLNPGRLRDQLFAYTVTNQAINTFVEIGLPFVLRYIHDYRKKKAASSSSSSASSSPSGGASDAGSDNGVKKRVVFEDEQEKGGIAERKFLDAVREEAALPEYDTFVDYSEMVVQFGYVVLWSTIWPLAGVMAFLNNILEIRSDAFKMTVHTRRPMPSRTDTIGPWLDALTFLTWLGALTNSALIYLFSPQLGPSSTSATATITRSIVQNLKARSAGAATKTVEESLKATLGVEQHLVAAADPSSPASSWGVDGTTSPATLSATTELLLKAILVALIASHGFLLVRSLIRHVIEKIYWKGSGEVEEREREEREVKERFLGIQSGGGDEGKTGRPELKVMDLGSSNILVGDEAGGAHAGGDAGDVMGFWEHDEGIEEIHRLSKEA